MSTSLQGVHLKINNCVVLHNPHEKYETERIDLLGKYDECNEPRQLEFDLCCLRTPGFS